MIPPFIVVLEDRDIHLCTDKVTDVEPQDAEYCLAYDANGKVLNLVSEQIERERHFLGFKWRSNYKGVVLVETIPAREDVTSLNKALISYLSVYHKISEHKLQSLSTFQLIEEVKSRKKPANDGSYL